MSKKILIIASDFPYPPNHGGRVDVFERIKVLKSLDYQVSLVSTIKTQPNKDEMSYMENFIEDNLLIKRRQSIFDLFSCKPYQVTSRNNHKDIKVVLKNIRNETFDACIVEGHYGLDLFESINRSCNINKKYLRVHNDERKYFKELAKSTNNILKKIFYYLESIKFSYYEKNFFKKNIIKACLHVSDDEYKIYKNNYQFINHIFLPASVDVNDFKKYTKKNNKTVLFIGSLFMPNNIEGLMWYLKNIHNNLCKIFQDYNLVIAGNSKGFDVQSFIETLNKFTNIIFYDSPENLDDLYLESCVFINPMLSGAGVKLKTINAVKYGLPIVSTEIGNEGTGLIHKSHLLVAKNDNDFLQHMIHLLEDESLRNSLVLNAQRFLLENYNQTKNLWGLIR
ncbi:MAG: hypothetical protein KN64_14640 [Sulfurovum sp. AS07-7]|nr:MAG: hypothetical protein KN64_14640 [Sulfurovum sp. AS07-7]